MVQHNKESTGSEPPSRSSSTKQSVKEVHGSEPDHNVVEPSKKRNRTSLACRECRSRKIKCDTIRPICGTCQLRGRHATCSYESLVDRDKRRETERYVHLLEAELSQYKNLKAGEELSPSDRSLLSQPAIRAPSSASDFTVSQSPREERNGTDTAGAPHVSSAQRQVPIHTTVEQGPCGSSTRSFMVEVQQAPILSSFAMFDEIPQEPGAKAGFFTRELNDQLAKFPSLSESNGARVSLLTPSWLQHLEDVYFTHIHHFFPFLDPENWHGKGIAQILTSGATNVNEDLSSFEASALCMVDMVYALGALWSMRLDHQQSLAVSERFFLAAKKLVTLDDLETPNLHLAQNLMLIAQYCIARTHRQRGFIHASLTYLSLVIRVCRSLKFSSIIPTSTEPSQEFLGRNIWRGCMYYDIVFASSCGEPTMVHSREYRAQEDLHVAMDNDSDHPLRMLHDTYYENNVRLAILIQRVCGELYDTSPTCQKNLQTSLFNADFSLLQGLEISLGRWDANLPLKFKLAYDDDSDKASLLREQRLNLYVRYYYAQMLLYRPALSCLLKLQSQDQASDNRNLRNSFAQESLQRFALKGLQASVHTIDLLLTCQESGRELMTPMRNFTPMCFYLYNAMLVIIAARCSANDFVDEQELHKNWRKAYSVMQFYEHTARTFELPFRFFEVINERLFYQSTQESSIREHPSHLLQASESWNMFDWYPEDDIYNAHVLSQPIPDHTIQSVDTMSSQWLGSFLAL